MTPSTSYIHPNTPIDRFMHQFDTVTDNIMTTRDLSSNESAIALLQDHAKLATILSELNSALTASYTHQHLIYWLSKFTHGNPKPISDFLDEKLSLNTLCHLFIRFCFTNNIKLDRFETLHSFTHHDALLDKELKRCLNYFPKKQNINLLGFGLDSGEYETNIANFLIDTGKARTVTIFGFDPYATQSEHIRYLSQQEIHSHENRLNFDIIIARWALHHVCSQDRWSDFIACLSQANKHATALIAEHGFLNNTYSKPQKLIYKLINAFFDIVANIGLRPQYFTNSTIIGSDFFIDYLDPLDLQKIVATLKKNRPELNISLNYRDIGPYFPCQTLGHLILSNEPE